MIGVKALDSEGVVLAVDEVDAFIVNLGLT
jgi:hypothetical protein